MEKFRIIDNKVFVNSHEEICFQNNIVGIMGSSNLLFVLTEPTSPNENETNLFAISETGHIKWRMQNPRDLYDLDEQSTKVFNVRFNEKNQIVATGYFGHGFVIDPLDGTILGREDSK